ncbi:MAG TPA: endonuclease/exonuclease/phosphatase family protein [Kofleriaceae bacterium]|nr:endonuclease/exonuclease/phosphatase family protein [Kofleriaceae bacterium]
MRRLPLALVLLAAGCLGDPGDEPADPEDQDFTGDKADGFCVDAVSDDAAGLLDLVNDAAVTLEMLDDARSDGGAGLQVDAARGIVEGRPFADLAAIDAVPFVGVRTCEALRAFACDVRHRCAPPLTVLSWNVEQFPLAEPTLDVVAGAIAELAHPPDAIGFQEIRDTAALEKLATELGDYEVHLGKSDGFTRVAVVTNRARVRVDAVETLFPDDRDAFPRAPVFAHLAVDAGDGTELPLLFAVVHLKAMEDAASHTRRREAVRLLRQALDERAAAGERAAVAVGDWNDRLTDTGDGNVFGAFQSDDAYAFLTAPLAAAGDVSYIPLQTLIDHVLLSAAGRETFVPRSTEVRHLDETIEGYTEVVSDHRPVVSELGLRPTAE